MGDRKKILIITTNFYPEKTGIGVVATNFATMINEIGCEVTVLCAMPYYPEWKIHARYQGKFFSSETINGVKVKRVWLYVPKKVRTVARLIHEASFAILMFFRALFIPCDLIIFISPPLSAGAASVVLSWLKMRPLWCYVQDIQPDAAIALGLLKNKWMVRVSKWLEGFLYRFSKKILVLSDGMKRNILNKGVVSDKLNIVPNAAMIEEYAITFTDSRQSKFRTEYGLQDKFLALYSGNIGVKQNPLILVEVAETLKNDTEIFIAVVGDGALRLRLEEAIARKALSNIAVFPLRPEALFGDMLVSADALLAPQRFEVVDFVMPSKLLSYLASGTPVLASANELSDLAMVLRDNNAGLVCEAENAVAFSELILKVKRNAELGRKLAETGKKLIRENYSKDMIVENYIKPLLL